MTPPQLSFFATPKLTSGTLLLALGGWMDGGRVSTGTVEHLMSQRTTKQIARIAADDFYIFNFPGDMETSALFRPHVKYADGVVTEFDMPSNAFYCDEPSKLVFFIGREPNLRWQTFADCIFEVCKQVEITRIVFIGSFGGSVPHTREPRMYGSVSHPRLRQEMTSYGVRLSDYEGPGSFSTMLLSQCGAHGVEMLSFVAEIPGYLQGINPRSIESVTRRLGKMLNLSVNMDRLREASNEWEQQVTELVEKDEDLAANIHKLEEDYDNQLITEEG